MRVVDVHAVVPVKNLGHAKQRLAGILDQPARTALFRAMLEDVLEALAGAASLAGIVLVTRDPEAIALAERYGAECLIGHTAAVEFAAKALAGRGAGALLQVPGDIPCVTSSPGTAATPRRSSSRRRRSRGGALGRCCRSPEIFPA